MSSLTTVWGASQIWGGNSVAGKQCQRLFTVFWRDALQAGLAVRRSPSCEGRNKAGTYLDPMGLAGRGLARHIDWALVTNVYTRSARHVVGEGALRGRSPRTREGRMTAQMRVESEEERVAGSSGADWNADKSWSGFCRGLREFTPILG